MSDRSPSERVAIALAIAALTAVSLGTGALLGALYAPHTGYQTAHPAYRSAQAEDRYPDQIHRDRAGLPYFAERIASGPDPEDGTEREKRDLAAQESVSVWTFWILMISAVGVGVTVIGTVLLFVTIRQGQKTYGAFVAVEDASLIVEFPEGSKIESYRDNVRLPDTYYFAPVISNIGRSTARIQGWAVGSGKFERREHSLAAGETWKARSKVEFEGPPLTFEVTFFYKTALRSMKLVVVAKVRARILANGATHYSAKVKSSRLLDNAKS